AREPQRSRATRHHVCSGRRAPGTILSAGSRDIEVRRTQPGVRQRSGRWLGGAPVRRLRRQARRAGRPAAGALLSRSRECSGGIPSGAAAEGRHARSQRPAPSRVVGHPARSNRQPGDESERDAHAVAARPAERRSDREDGHRRPSSEGWRQPVPDCRRPGAMGGRRDLRAGCGRRSRRHSGDDHRGRAPRADVSRKGDVHLPAARREVEPRRSDSRIHAANGDGAKHGRDGDREAGYGKRDAGDARHGYGPEAPMIEKLIAWSIKRRELVALGAIFVLVAGVFLLRTMPVDAIPDLSDTQVIVYTDYPGQAPQVVEDQVTYPLLTTFLAVPKVKVVRGQSMFSSSFVYVIFQDRTDLYWARSRVLEYLNAIQSRLPAGAKTRLG